jgi:hypothetical protein
MFEYTDGYQQTFRTMAVAPDYPGQPIAAAIWVEISDGAFDRTAVQLPLDRVEEVIAGIRDAARQAAVGSVRPAAEAAS